MMKLLKVDNRSLTFKNMFEVYGWMSGVEEIFWTNSIFIFAVVTRPNPTQPEIVSNPELCLVVNFFFKNLS